MIIRQAGKPVPTPALKDVGQAFQPAKGWQVTGRPGRRFQTGPQDNDPGVSSVLVLARYTEPFLTDTFLTVSSMANSTFLDRRFTAVIQTARTT